MTNKIWQLWPMWKDGRCFIIGGGPSMPGQFGVPDDIISKVHSGELLPSAYSAYMEAIHGEHVIAVNNAYQLGDWPSAMFFGDCVWFVVHQVALAKWPNLKVTCCPRPNDMKNANVKYLAKDRKKRLGLSENPKTIAWNFNSGACAINMAVHLGVRQIILLGFDMVADGKATHWHVGHGHDKPPNFPRHLQGFPVIAEDARRLGVEVVNCSPISAITAFKRAGLREVL